MQLFELRDRARVSPPTLLIGAGVLVAAVALGILLPGPLGAIRWALGAVGIAVVARGLTYDRAFRYLAIGAAATVLVVLGAIAVTMTERALPVFEHMGLEFFTSSRWAETDEHYGALAFIFGTLYTATIALALAVPVSLGVALFITQVAPAWLRRPLVAVIDLCAVVPSVVWGLWGVLVLSQHVGLGRSFATAGVILAIMITPIITSLAREVIETTPRTDKEAALALGATRWEMVAATVLPHSKAGLVGAVMLGLGRAMGETIAVALVIGSALGQITLDPLAPGNSMPAVIANEWGEADELHKSALIALAVTLFVITIVVNLVATAIVRRSSRRTAR
jgi:phosphate transport system permease protein